MMAKNKPQAFKKDKKKVKCYQCGKLGHYKNECRQKKPSQDRNDAHVAFQAKTEGQVQDKDMWVVDSGASDHMCNDKTLFQEIRTPRTARYVSVAKAGTKLKILGIGTVHLKLQVNQEVVQAKLEDTLLVEDLARNLFSVSAVTKRGMKVEMNQDGCKIKHSGKVVAVGHQSGSLVYLDVVPEASAQLANKSSDLWHRRFGHASSTTLKTMQKNGLIDSKIQISSDQVVCETCAMAKQAKTAFKKRSSAQDHKNTICSDVMGPITPNSVSGNRFVVPFIDMSS